MRLSKKLNMLAVILLLPVMARADWERTLSAWDTRLPNKGKTHVSLWGDYFKSEIGNADFTDKAAYLDLTYGISDKWSACLSPSFYAWDQEGGKSESGVSDTMLQTTYRFRDEAANSFDLAVMGELSFPTGSKHKDLGSGSLEPGGKLLASKTYGPMIAVVNLSAKAILNADKGEKDLILSTTLEGVYPLNDKLSLNASASAATARFSGADALVDLGLGTRYNVKDQLFVGGILYKCLTDAYDWGVQLTAGVQF